MMSDAQAMYFTSEVGSSVLWRYNCMWSARLAVLFRIVLSSYRVGVLSVSQSREIQSASSGKSLKNERGASIARAALWRRAASTRTRAACAWTPSLSSCRRLPKPRGCRSPSARPPQC